MRFAYPGYAVAKLNLSLMHIALGIIRIAKYSNSAYDVSIELTEFLSMNATTHFQTRAQQRAISAPMVEMIFNLGQINSRGDLILLGQKDIDQAVRKLKALLHDLDKMRAHGGAGIAFAGDTLITTFHRHKKFKRS